MYSAITLAKEFFPLISLALIGAAWWIAAKRSPAIRPSLRQAQTLTIGSVFFLVLIRSAMLSEVWSIESLLTKQYVAEDHRVLLRGINVRAEVLPAFPYYQREQPKLEFDDQDSATLAVWLSAKTVHNRCPIHPADASITVSAPAFDVGPSLPENSTCNIGWQIALAPKHGGLESLQVGISFAPKWLKRPEQHVLHMTIRVLEPRSMWSNPLIQSVVAAFITTLLTLAGARFSRPAPDEREMSRGSIRVAPISHGSGRKSPAGYEENATEWRDRTEDTPSAQI